jgi:hypothetical protein
VAVVTFEDRIRDLAGTPITAFGEGELQQFIIDGCYDVINKLKRSGEYDAQQFVSASSAIVNATPTDVDNFREVEYVERNGYPCREVPPTQRQFLENANSIYKATADDPVFYIFNNQITIVPDPTGSETAILYTLPADYSITNFDSGTSSIDKFPKQYYEHIMLYAAYMALGKQLLQLIQDTTPTNMSFDVIEKMFNNELPDATGDVFEWLKDEDAEMAGATLSAIQGASALTNQKFQLYKDRMMSIRGEYIGKFNFQPQGGQA